MRAPGEPREEVVDLPQRRGPVLAPRNVDEAKGGGLDVRGIGIEGEQCQEALFRLGKPAKCKLALADEEDGIADER